MSLPTGHSVRACAKERVSETTVHIRAMQSALSWQINIRTSESYMSLGPKCLVTNSPVVMTTDHKDVTHAPASTKNRTFCQGQPHNKRQRLTNE